MVGWCRYYRGREVKPKPVVTDCENKMVKLYMDKFNKKVGDAKNFTFRSVTQKGNTVAPDLYRSRHFVLARNVHSWSGMSFLVRNVKNKKYIV